MKVWTSYYGKRGALPEGTIGVAVSASIPDWGEWKVGDRVRLAIPTDQNEETWAGSYRELMTKDRLEGVWRILCAIARKSGRDPVLLCYERDASQCHRTILFELLNAAYGVEGGELGDAQGQLAL